MSSRRDSSRRTEGSPARVPTRFCSAHASFPDWRTCTERLLEQLAVQQADPARFPRANLGIVYISTALAEHAQDIHGLLSARTGVTDWVGAIGGSLIASGTAYHDEPAIVTMLLTLPGDSFQIFHGTARPRPVGSQTSTGAWANWSALVHADPSLPDIADLVADMSSKVEGGHLFGAVASGDAVPLPQIANRTLDGGLSGAVFSSDVRLRTRLTQGCVPLASAHQVSRCEENLVLELDGHPALDVLLQDLGVDDQIRASRDGQVLLGAFPAQKLRLGLYAGLGNALDSQPDVSIDWQVRSVMGIDPQNRVVAIGGEAVVGERLVFCTRDARAARRDLVGMVTSLRDGIESEGLKIKGGVYFTCMARGETLAGQLDEETAVLRENLGDIPLIGLAGNGEIAGRHLHSYSGVLTLFL